VLQQEVARLQQQNEELQGELKNFEDLLVLLAEKATKIAQYKKLYAIRGANTVSRCVRRTLTAWMDAVRGPCRRCDSLRQLGQTVSEDEDEEGDDDAADLT